MADPIQGEDGMSMEAHEAVPEPHADTTSGAPSTSAWDPEGSSSTSDDSLLPPERSDAYRERWRDVQGAFVDDPRKAVEQADRLVTEVVEQLQTVFTTERNDLEGQWQRGGDVDTEQLRTALQRYRTFFDRLLAA